MEVRSELGGILPFPHEVLGRGRIDFSEYGRIPRRPTVRLEIADVEVIVSPNAAHGVSDSSGAPRRVPLAGEDYVVSRGIDSALIPRLEHVEETATGHFGQWLETGGLEDCRCNIDQTDEIGHHALGGHSFRPANGEGHTRAEIVQVGLGAGERHAVVACHDDDGVGQLIALLQERNDFPELAVEALDLEVVVQEVATNFGHVGKEVGHAHVIEAQPAGQARALFVTAMRIRAAEPEAERRSVRQRGVERTKVIEPRSGWIP